MHVFWYYLRQCALLTIVLIIAWIPGRSMAPPALIQSPVGHVLDLAVYNTWGRFLSIFGIHAPSRYQNSIVRINTAEITFLLEKAAEKGYMMLVYVYNDDCSTCDSNFNDVVDIAKEYMPKGLRIMAIAVMDSEEELTKYLNTRPMTIPFTPLISSRAKKHLLLSQLNRLGAQADDLPFLGIMTRGNHIIRIGTGVNRKKKLEKYLKHL